MVISVISMVISVISMVISVGISVISVIPVTPVSAIKFRKRLTKFKITIALPKKFGSKGSLCGVNI